MSEVIDEIDAAQEAAPRPTRSLQLRLTHDEVHRIRTAAAEREQTISQFMLACVHAHSGKHD